MSSENFVSAGRGMSSGWVACHVVSQWTWAATLLQSSNVAYAVGVSGPFWSVMRFIFERDYASYFCRMMAQC